MDRAAELVREHEIHVDVGGAGEGALGQLHFPVLGQDAVGSEAAHAAALPGDAWRLRGLPAIGGRGSVGGAIRGSLPHVDGVRNVDRR